MQYIERAIADLSRWKNSPMIDRYRPLVVAVSLTAVLGMSPIHPSFAQPTSTPSGGDPKEALGSRGGGSRGLCDGLAVSETSVWHSLIALTPRADNVISAPLDQTNLYVYTPGFVGEANKSAAFVQIVDMDTGDLVLETQVFDLESNNAIARLVLPDALNLTPTETERYFWQLIVVCDPEDEEQDLFVEGWLQPVAPGDTVDATWHEQMERWFAQRDTNATPWVEGLTAVGLGALAELPVQTYELSLPDTAVTE